MKKIIIALCLLLSSLTIQAQEGLTWHTDLNKAIEVSNNESKPLFLFFTGSDWCGWCIRLQKEVFRTPEFTAWAKEKVVLVELDFPRRTPQDEAVKLQNNQLQQLLEVRGYPTVFFVTPTLTAAGKINLVQLGSTGYVAGGPQVWIEGANQFLTKFVPNPKPVATKKADTKKADTKKKA